MGVVIPVQSSSAGMSQSLFLSPGYQSSIPSLQTVHTKVYIYVVSYKTNISEDFCSVPPRLFQQRCFWQKVLYYRLFHCFQRSLLNVGVRSRHKKKLLLPPGVMFTERMLDRRRQVVLIWKGGCCSIVP